MKYLINSTTFYPAVGGLENVAMDMATEFTKAGHEVKVVTLIPAKTDTSTDFPFEIVRQPSQLAYIRLIRWADVALHFNVTIKGIWQHLFLSTPLVLSHQSPMKHHETSERKRAAKVGFVNRIPILNIACSHYVTEQFDNCIAIPNSYNHQLFRIIKPVEERKGELVYLGRLVSIKGVDLLLEALHLLKKEGIEPKLSIIGDGEDRVKLERLTQDLGLSGQVRFEGVKTGEDLVKALNDHQIMVIPSLWKEAFGIVALEGIACGLTIVASEGGGLIDAVGPCGLTFPNGNKVALAEAIKDVYQNEEKRQNFQAAAEAHLRPHKRSAIAQQYLTAIEQALS